MYERSTGAAKSKELVPHGRRKREMTRRFAALGAAFFGAISLAVGIWLAEGQANGVLVVHSKGQVASIYSRLVDPTGFQLALCVGVAVLAFSAISALWCTWRMVKPDAPTNGVN